MLYEFSALWTFTKTYSQFNIAVVYVLQELAPSRAFTRVYFGLYGYIVRAPRFVSWVMYLFGSKLLMRNATALASCSGPVFRCVLHCIQVAGCLTPPLNMISEISSGISSNYDISKFCSPLSLLKVVQFSRHESWHSYVGRPGRRQEDNIKMDYQETVWGHWSGLIWLRTRKGGWLLWTR